MALSDNAGFTPASWPPLPASPLAGKPERVGLLSSSPRT